jgi:metal-responsive CopG/Arc/MetJ family transcriptional regulator
MAKVMISIPDQLLKRIDDYARSKRETRSGFLQRVAEREISSEDAQRRDEIQELLGKVMIEGLPGNAAELIREDRESH